MATLKLTNNNLLDSTSLKLFPDFTNILADVTIAKNSEGQTTIAQDCFIRVLSESSHNTLYINGMHWATNSTSPGSTIAGDSILYHTIPLRKGDVIKKYAYYGISNTNDGTLRYILIGIK